MLKVASHALRVSPKVVLGVGAALGRASCIRPSLLECMRNITVCAFRRVAGQMLNTSADHLDLVSYHRSSAFVEGSTLNMPNVQLLSHKGTLRWL